MIGVQVCILDENTSHDRKSFGVIKKILAAKFALSNAITFNDAKA